jgi:AbrB family looped-hinge helix DNA binding protein
MKEITVQIDQAGRVVVPKSLRERLRLSGGDTLVIDIKGDAIELRPIHPVEQLKRVNGILVFTPTGTLPYEDFVEQSREERIESVLEGGKHVR